MCTWCRLCCYIQCVVGLANSLTGCTALWPIPRTAIPYKLTRRPVHVAKVGLHFHAVAALGHCGRCGQDVQACADRLAVEVGLAGSGVAVHACFKLRLPGRREVELCRRSLRRVLAQRCCKDVGVHVWRKALAGHLVRQQDYQRAVALVLRAGGGGVDG